MRALIGQMTSLSHSALQIVQNAKENPICKCRSKDKLTNHVNREGKIGLHNSQLDKTANNLSTACTVKKGCALKLRDFD